MSERVAELVRVDLTDPRSGGSPADHLHDARGCHRTLPADPQLGQVRSPDTEVAVDRLDGLRTDRENPHPRALPDDGERLVVEIHVGHPQVGDLGQPGTGVDEGAKDDRVATCDDVGASHAFSRARSSVSDSTAGGSSGMAGDRMRSIGFDVISPSSIRQRNSC